MSKSPIILLEGADAAGKSTIAQEFSDFYSNRGYSVRRVHNGPPSALTGRALYHVYLNQLELAVYLRKLTDRITIIDRSFPSEAIYGPTFRGQSLLKPKHIAKLERYCVKHDIWRFGITTPDTLRRSRMVDRGESFDRQPEIGALYNTYFHENSWAIVGSKPPASF